MTEAQPRRRAPMLPTDVDPRGSGRRRDLVTRDAADRDRPTAAAGGGPPRPRVVRAVVAAVSAVVLVISVVGWVGYTYFNANFGRVHLSLGSHRPPGEGGVENYLLVGTDSRAGTNGQYGDTPGQRSDTTILVHLAKDGTTTMVSFPRDTVVTIPEYTDTSGRHHAEQRNKFNTALTFGGPSLLVRTVENLTDIRVDHYVSVDLAGFKAMADAIGGVNVCIKPSSYREYVAEDGRYSTNTNDPMSGFVGGPGTIHVNGELGLAFVRQRHGLVNGDIGRIQRQQQFLGAVFRKATTGGVLANPIKLEGLVSTATSALTLDNDTSIGDLRKLMSRLRGVAATKVRMETIPTHISTAADGATGSGGYIPGIGDALSYDPDGLERMLAPLRASGSDSSASATPTTLPASQVTVVVFNGSGIAGLASSTTTKLAARGFHATVAGNASTHYVTSTVLYGSGQEAAARTVAAAVPGAKIQSDSSVTGVQLVLGSSFTGVGSSSGATASGGTTSGGTAAVTPTAPAATNALASCTY